MAASQVVCFRQAPRRSTEGGESQAAFLKTKMCTFYKLGACARGSSCRYAHSDRDLNPDSFYRTRFCKSMIRLGKCDAVGCTYAHSKSELRDPVANEGGVDNGAEEQGFVKISNRIEQLPFAQREQLLKNQLLILPTSQRAHILTWLLQQFPGQALSSQQGDSEAQESHEQSPKLHTRLRAATYSFVTQDEHVPAVDPVWLDSRY